jgi:predicted helicase
MNHQEIISTYLAEVERYFNSGQAGEHAYRPALKSLMESFEDTSAVNDPKRSQHGMPDFVFLKRANSKIIKGYAEAKDIKPDILDKTEKTEQMERYHGYANLFLTDYLEFRFFKNGEKYKTISLGKVKDGRLSLSPENSEELVRELKEFLELPPEQIKSGRRLAEIMGGKARRIRDNVALYLKDDHERNQELEKMYSMMRELLVHDLEEKKFADMYAQTLVYGLFVARYSDKSPESFSRQEARDLVPKSNPFLRKFFDHIAGSEFDERLGYIVDELCEVFQVSNVKSLIQKHLKLIEFKDGQGDEKDPIIHFYEDFLKEYDPEERKRMGAYYTPIPVVKFMINQVDRIIKEEFKLSKGLADTSKIDYTTKDQTGKKFKNQIHRVQILDPAVGTATFLNETIKFIHEGFKGQEGRWPSYAERDLLPRLHGFELMMAPYTIAHLKLGMTLQETGLEDFSSRLGVYLTNTLEEGIPRQTDIFSYGLAEAVTEESAKASEIKHNKPIMVIIGNPPYSGVSSNETKYANSLVAKYKVEPGGISKLNERKHWLNDDYVKFISFAEDMIAKNGEGIVAMITNHGYLDNPTFRGMRWHLSQTFDKIYILDLHGNAKKKEVAPDGSKDENVFNIMQGVSIILGVKTSNKTKTDAEVYHADLYGKRKLKFSELLKKDLKFKQIKLDQKQFYLADKNTEGKEEYESGISVESIYLKVSTGVQTSRDGIAIAHTKNELEERIRLFSSNLTIDELRSALGSTNTSFWDLSSARNYVISEGLEPITEISYRPFDKRYIYFSDALVHRRKYNFTKNMLKDNLMLTIPRQLAATKHDHIFISTGLPDMCLLSNRTKEAGYLFPLYLYHNDGTKTPNLNVDELAKLNKNLKSEYQPEDVLDYIYDVLHSPSYREKYKEFLKIDFPRVPIPKDDKEFVKFKDFGTKLRGLHLMTDPSLEDYITTYPEPGTDIVEQIKFNEVEEKIWINNDQYFGQVPEVAWNFYIGGYQPAQKWLKDRKGRKLNNDDIDHYQKIIKVLVETDKIMNEIG